MAWYPHHIRELLSSRNVRCRCRLRCWRGSMQPSRTAAFCEGMDADLKRLYDGFRGNRTMCSGSMGVLAMLHEGDFAGKEEPIVKDLLAAATSVTQKLEALRDTAAGIPRSCNAGVDEVAAIILALEEQMRQPLQVLSAHLASEVPGLPKPHWKDDLQNAQAVLWEMIGGYSKAINLRAQRNDARIVA